MDYDILNKIIGGRAKTIGKMLKDINTGKEHVGKSIWIAGGCLTGTINDIDVFPVPNSFNKNDNPFLYLPVLSKTKNATTFDYDPIIQFCNYIQPSIQELVQSFDFAHIQVGAEIAITIQYEDAERPTRWEVREIYFTDAFVEANAGKTTWGFDGLIPEEWIQL